MLKTTMFRRLIQRSVGSKSSSNVGKASMRKSLRVEATVNSEEPNRLSLLPGEILERIFSFLDLSSLLLLRFTCKGIHDVATPMMLGGEITVIPCKSQITEVLQFLRNPLIARSVQTLNCVFLDVHTVLAQFEGQGPLTIACVLTRGPFANRSRRKFQEHKREQERAKIRRFEIGDSLRRQEDPDRENEIQLLCNVLAHVPNLKSVRATFPHFSHRNRLEDRGGPGPSPDTVAASYYQRLLRRTFTEWDYPYVISNTACIELRRPTSIFQEDVPDNMNNVRRVIERSYRLFEALKSSAMHLEKLEFCRVPRIDADGRAVQAVLPREGLEICSSLKKLVVGISRYGEDVENSRSRSISNLWENILDTAHELRELSISGDEPPQGTPCADLYFPITTHIESLRNLILTNVSFYDSALIQCLRNHAETLLLVEFSNVELLWNGSDQSCLPAGWIAIIKLLRDELTLNRVTFGGRLAAEARHEIWTVCKCDTCYTLRHGGQEDGGIKLPITDECYAHRVVDLTGCICCTACPKVSDLDAKQSMATGALSLYHQITRYITRETDTYPSDLQDLEDILTLAFNRNEKPGGWFAGDHSWLLTSMNDKRGRGSGNEPPIFCSLPIVPCWSS